MVWIDDARRRWRDRGQLVVALAVACGLVPAALMADRLGDPAPRPVSPGTEGEVVTAAGRCPTFSWSGGAGARAYELAVYRLTDAGPDAEPAVRQEVPGPSFAWTPPRRRCLASGARYAWVVRARVGDRWGEWSPASLFAVAAEPSLEEVEEALDVVRRYQAAHPVAEPPALAREPPTPHPPAAGEAPAERGEPARVAMAGAFASGPDRVGLSAQPSGQGSEVVYAVHGVTSDDIDGSAGVVGEVTSNVLGPQTYGVIGFHEGLGSGGAAGAFVRDQGGDILQGYFGAAKVFSVDTGGNSALDGNLQLSGSLLCNSCVTSLNLLDGTVRGRDLADGTVSGADLEDDSVGEGDLAAGAVGADELDQVVVVSVECSGSCDDITLGQVCGFAGADKRPVFVDCRDVDDDSGSSCGGDNTCSAFTLDAADSLGALCTDGSGWDANVYCLDDDDGGYP